MPPYELTHAAKGPNLVAVDVGFDDIQPRQVGQKLVQSNRPNRIAPRGADMLRPASTTWLRLLVSAGYTLNSCSRSATANACSVTFENLFSWILSVSKAALSGRGSKAMTRPCAPTSDAASRVK
jgi:hypothetical protein